MISEAKGLKTMGILKRNKNIRHNEQDYDENSAPYISPASSDKSGISAPSLELIAVITAAVQAFMGTGKQNRLIVRSFRRISSDNSLWNSTSRYEQLNGKL